MRYNYTNGVSEERNLSILAVVLVAVAASLITLITLIQTTYATAEASTTEVVVESSVTRQAEGTAPTNEWVVYTRAGTPDSAAAFRDGPAMPPLGTGSLELTTNTGTEKVYAFNYNHIGTKLSEVGAISYSTYRSAGNLQQVTALNVEIDFNGPEVPGGYSTLVFEPVYNTDQGAVVSGEWQDWVANGSGVWWSTRAIDGQCAGATSACDKTWDEIVFNNPAATILGGVGVNQGSGNDGLRTAVDAFTFDEVTYDFERVAPKPLKASSKDECKNGNWKDGFQTPYKNQGQCVSSVANNKNN